MRSGGSLSSPFGTRISSVWESALPISPSGYTVVNPSSGSASSVSGVPFSSTTRRPRRQPVSFRLRPGAGPSDSTGSSRASPSAPPAPASARTSTERRRTRGPSSSANASSSASCAPGREARTWRSSTASCAPSSLIPHSPRPTPSAPSTSAHSTPSSWVCPPRKYRTNRPTPAAAVTPKHTSTSRSVLRCSRVRSAPPCRGSRAAWVGSCPAWSCCPLSTLSPPSGPGPEPAHHQHQQAQADHPGHEPLRHRALAADRDAAAVEPLLVQRRHAEHGGRDVLAAERRPGPAHAVAGGARLPVQPLAAGHVALAGVHLGDERVADRLADVRAQRVDLLLGEVRFAAGDGRARGRLEGHPPGADRPVDRGGAAHVLQRRDRGVLRRPVGVGPVAGGARLEVDPAPLRLQVP